MSMQASAQNQLRQFVDRIERLEGDKAGIAEDIRDAFAEAKSNGFDPRIMRQVIRMRKRSQTERQEEESVVAVYLGALGMLSDTPLGQAAIAREFGAEAAAN